MNVHNLLEKISIRYYDVRVMIILLWEVRAYVLLGDVLIFLGIMKPEGYVITHGKMDDEGKVTFIKRI